jgi:hypothetical protein
MNKRTSACLALSAALAIVQPAISPEASAQVRVSSEQTVGGFAFPESVAYDPRPKCCTSASSAPSSIRC